MTPNLNNWLGGSAIDAEARAADAWARIQRDPVSVVLVRNDTVLDAQTVRVELGTEVREGTPEGVSASRRQGTLFGIKGHATLPDTDVKRGDVFRYNETRFRVVSVNTFPGEIQAEIEALQ